VWLFRVAVALLPALVLLRQDNAIFAPPHNIDNWLYFGYFRHLAEFKMTYRATYYGSRLAWVLPGWAIHSLFAPLLASFVLHLTVHITASLSLFEILRRTVALRAAFLAALVFSFSPQLWAATGWDYTDGAGIAYCLLAMALATGTAERRPSALLLALAGAAFAGMIYTNLFWIALAPAVGVYCLALQWAWRAAAFWRNALRTALWMAAGAAALTGALCVVNHSLDGLWWFYEPSVRAARDLYKMPNPWFRGVVGPWGLAPWLWFTALAAGLSILELALRLRRLEAPDARLRAGVAAAFLAGLASMSFFQFVRELPVLGLTFYASYLLPFTFLAIGALLWDGVEALSRGRFLGLCAGAAALFAVVWADYSGAFTPMWPAHAAPVACAGAALFIAARSARARWFSVPLALAACILFASETRYTSGFGPKHDPPNIPPRSAHDYREGFERVMQQKEQIDRLRGAGRVYFWYDESEPNRSEYWALNSVHLFVNSRLGERFPELVCHPKGGPAMPVREGTVVAISTRAPEQIELARRRLEACWAEKGLRPTPAAPDSRWTYREPYTFSLLRAEPLR
jgi:hypothetical protein